MSKGEPIVINTDNSSNNADRNKLKKPKKMLNDPRFQIRPSQQVASACTGAMITACFMTPLDVIKTRMQSQQASSHKCFLYCNGLMDHLFAMCNRRQPQFTSTLDALLKISRNEGIAALWSGLGPTLVSALPSTVVYFVAYEQFKARYTSIYKKHFDTPTAHGIGSSQKDVPLYVPMLSGVTARICAVTFVSPIELVRTKMQSQRLNYAQVMNFVRNIIALQGISGLWRGLPPTILRDVPFSGIYWPIYEYLKICLSNNAMQPSFGLSFFAGVLAGSVAALVTCPFDVVKTHEQIEFAERVIFTDSPSKELNKQSTFSRLASIYRVYGLRGLFAGCVPRLIKVAPACAIMISTFEYSKSFFFYYNVQQHNAQLLQNNPNAKLINDEDID
ncbi:probable mitochondrial glutathione transporter SLC25A40 [Drosophila sulfurigaster albostrigata]|uniref:probable mitochondrial glutathione transporter SLC25A40 n=1 Tax=Drosophila sulfurigaster albostrigata TaxID=89887 RepID=UPI002D2197B1|nr:probable mitochondrial glutathione transporter SLC25A40 [Drosophila sulfurigaster albostrigata]